MPQQIDRPRLSVVKHGDGVSRCAWCGPSEIERRYHDEEWGEPVRDDADLFEKLCLDGAQAGLSWLTILKKREGYRQAFDAFDPEKMARYDEAKTEALMRDPGIVRNRLKIRAFVANARAYLRLMETSDGFAAFLWRFTDGRTLRNVWNTIDEVPASTPESKAMSAALSAQGFKFVGPTICYAFMQAVGMVDDHVIGCFKRGAAPR